MSENRKILNLLDNFSGHIANNLSSIEISYLSPNSTSLLQSLDQGIIYSFKCGYKAFLAVSLMQNCVKLVLA